MILYQVYELEGTQMGFLEKLIPRKEMWFDSSLDGFLDEPINYKEALAFMVGLSDADYKKLTAIAAIQRKSKKRSAQVLGEPDEPTTYITPPEPPTMADSTFTDADGKINIVTTPVKTLTKR